MSLSKSPHTSSPESAGTGVNESGVNESGINESNTTVTKSNASDRQIASADEDATPSTMDIVDNLEIAEELTDTSADAQTNDPGLGSTQTNHSNNDVAGDDIAYNELLAETEERENIEFEEHIEQAEDDLIDTEGGEVVDDVMRLDVVIAMVSSCWRCAVSSRARLSSQICGGSSELKFADDIEGNDDRCDSAVRTM